MSGAAKYDPQKTVLSPASRRDVLRKIQAGTTYDLVVIGAGVTGAGVALDAASRGLRVLIVEAQDLAFGTSRWSSKLAHGGLRYLATGNVGIARRSAVERGAMMETIAPHLTRVLPQVVAVQSFNPLNFIPRLGFIAGDLLRIAAGTSSRTLPRSRTVSAKKVAELCPGVADHVKFGFINYDGQLVDDARLVTALTRTAAGYGADVLTHCEAGVDAGREDSTDLKLVRLAPTAQLPGEREFFGNEGANDLTVRSAGVISATGVWAGDVEKDILVTPSRGTHVVVDADKVGNPTGALTVAVPGTINRYCFILPVQLGRCYIGLTDEPAEFQDVPKAPEEDIDWVLNVVNQALKTTLTRDDVLSAFAGLRPLVQLRSNNADVAGAGSDIDANDTQTSTADLSREHLILHRDGVVTVTGGKLTEYRLMAEQTVDEFLSQPEIRAHISGPVEDCRTKQIPLVGAAGRYCPVEEPTPAAEGITSAEPPLLEALVSRYGAEAVNVLRTSLLENGNQPVADLDITRAELSYAVTHEGALTVEDILDRRTRIGLVESDRQAAKTTAREALRAANATSN